LDINIIVGGPQGGGIETAGLLAIRSLALCGLEVFADREYHSNIKGKHSYSHIRASEKAIHSIKYPVDTLGGLDVETIATHYHEVKKGGVIVYEEALASKQLTKIPSMDEGRRERLRTELETLGIKDSLGALGEYCSGQGIRVQAIPFSKILVEAMRSPNPFIERTMNTAITSSLLALSGIPKVVVDKGVEATFREKAEVMGMNRLAVDSVYAFLSPKSAEPFTGGIGNKQRFLVAGNDAVAMGKLLGGLRLQTYYPITPAADESFAIEQHSELRDEKGTVIGSPVVVQAEDEIAAIAMAIGGALAGVRSATSTSGPGLCLMVEGFGWAGNSEVPVVITHYQRGGPSTGLPTRHSQSDLLFSVFAGHGEFARIVLASGDHLEALEDAAKILNFAERYQVPAIHLLDKGVANCITAITIEKAFKVDRGMLQGKQAAEGGDYKRFAINESGISPRAFLGDQLMWYTGDEHSEHGNISEDPSNRNRMYSKRMEKSRKILEELPDEDKAVLYGPEKYDDLIMTWGITKGAVLDALGSLGRSSRRVAALNVRLMEPFPSALVSEYLWDANEVIDIEANYLGMLAELVRMRCGIYVKHRILKYSGRLITEDEVGMGYAKIREGKERVVLSGGE
jgi:2-oxoglutarate ferredoxin oxidoreductase subunit alpha